MEGSKTRFPFWEITKINVRHNALFPILISIIVCVVTPIMTGMENLDTSSEAAMPLEMFISLVGVTMLIPVFQPEQNVEINDLVSSKYFSAVKVYIVRILYSIALTALFVGLSALYMSMRNCEISALLVLGTIADAVFLGSLGILASAVCNNTVIGYMLPLLYYTVNIGVGSKLGNFYLFSMSVENYGPKVWLFITGITFITLAIGCQKLRRLNM